MKITKYDDSKAIEVLRDRGFTIEELDKVVRIQEKEIVAQWAKKNGLSAAKARAEVREIMEKAKALKVSEGLARIIKRKKD